MHLYSLLQRHGLHHKTVMRLTRSYCYHGNPLVSVEPDDALIDQEIDIKVKGLASKQLVTLHSTLTENGARFGAYGCYIADNNGQVDVQKDICHAGTYTGVEPMGLFWSMRQAPGQNLSLRLLKKDVTLPLLSKLYVYNRHVDWNDLYNSDNLDLITATEIRRWYKAHDVRRYPVKEGSIRGSVFIPPGTGPFPGIIDLFGGAGGLIDFRAALLASKGFVVLALAYFAYDDLNQDISSQFSLDYFKEAVEWLIAQPYVNNNQIAVISVCKGAEMGMALATHCPKIKALVAINGVPFVINNPMKNGDSYIPCPDNNGYTIERLHFSKEGMIMKEAFIGEPKDVFQLWNTDTKVLYIVGDDDQCIPPKLGQTVYDLYPYDKKSNIELVIYPGAGHLIEPPYAPLCRASYMSSFGVALVWGGKPKEHAIAQKDSWDRIINFFKTTLTDNSDHCTCKSNL